MSLAFHLVRTKDLAAFSADANPNVTAPAAAAVRETSLRVSGQSANQDTRGVYLYVRDVDGTGAEVPAAVVSGTVWVRDDGASQERPGPAGESRWVAVSTFTNLPSSTAILLAVTGKVFVQLTATTPGTATVAEVWMTEKAV